MLFRELFESNLENDAFKRWFAGSKVVDKRGKPLKMFHGTNRSFTSFWPESHFGSKSAANDRLSSLRNIFGSKETGQHILPVYLKITNPLRVNDREASDEGTMMNAIARGDYPEFDIGYARKHGPYNAIKAAGYDGLVYSNHIEDAGKDSWVIFDPNQVKSAMSNSGAYSDSEHINEISRIPASAMNEKKIRGGIHTALSVKRKVVGQIGNVRVSMGQDGGYRYAIFSKDKIAYGFANLLKSTIGGVDGYYVEEIGLLDELRYEGVGYAFYKMLLDQNYTLFSGGTQTPDGEKTWRKLMHDPDVTVRTVRLDHEIGDRDVKGGEDPWSDPDIRLVAKK